MNIDSPMFRLPRQISTFLVGVAALHAGTEVERFSWNHQRWFHLDDFLNGRGERRSVMARAAAEALKAAGFPGLKVRIRTTSRTPDPRADGAPTFQNPYPHPSEVYRDVSQRELELTTRLVIARAIQLDERRRRPETPAGDLDEWIERLCLASRLWQYVRYPEDFPWASHEPLEAALAELTGEDRS